MPSPDRIPMKLLLAAMLFLPACAGLKVVPHRDVLTPKEHLQLAVSYDTQGLRESAEREYRAALRGDPRLETARLGLGNLLFAKGKLRAAEKQYRRVLKTSPRDPGACNNLAMILIERGKLDKAERFVRDALPDAGALRPYLLDTLARIRFRQGRSAEALRALEQARRETDPARKDILGQLMKTQEEGLSLPASR